MLLVTPVVEYNRFEGLPVCESCPDLPESFAHVAWQWLWYSCTASQQRPQCQLDSSGSIVAVAWWWLRVLCGLAHSTC